MITMGHERQRRDGGRKVLAAHDERDRRAGLGERALDIAHGDRRSEARAEAARRDRAEDRAVARFDLGTFARRHAPLGPQPDAQAARAVAQFGKHALGARKSAFLAPALLDRPGESGFDRRGAGVDVVAVEAEPRLEAQRVARAEADRLHLAVAEQALGDRAHAVRLDGNLIAVLAGVAGAADVTVDAVEARAARR